MKFTLIQISIVFSLLILFSSCSNNGKIGFVDLPKVFENFQYKKDMEAKLKKSEEERKKILDTLELKILSFESTLKSKKKISDEEIAYSRSLRIQFEKKNNEFENDTRNQVAEYDKLIIKQMSQYIQEYGEKNGFRFIFGRTEDNVLLYGNESCDVTKEVSSFINEKFNGK